MKKNMWNKNSLTKTKAGLTVAVLALAFFVSHIVEVKALTNIGGTSVTSANPLSNALVPTPGAGMPVVDTSSFLSRVVKLIVDKATVAWEAAGNKLFDATLRNTLNRVALDSAKYVGTAGEGQKSLFVQEDFKTYVTNLGDAAAGDFISSLGKTWQVDLCKIADPALTAKISLGLSQYQRPEAPNCTLSQLTSNYTSTYEKYAAMKSGDYLKAVNLSFEPGGGELSSAFALFNRTEAAKTTEADAQKLNLTVKQGWLDVTNIAGKTVTPPDTAKNAIAQTSQAKINTIATAEKGTNPFIAAANIFLNQLSYEAFQRVLRELGKGKSTSQPYDFTKPGSAFESLIQYGEAVVSEKLATIVKPRFDVRSDYSILSDLAVCVDKNNPGPNNCVIDDNFSQAIAEKVTVKEAIDKGYLHGDWLVSSDNKSDGTYNLRSAIILRKFRIVPVGWEQAITIASTPKYKGKITLQDLVSCFPGDGKGPFSADFDTSDQNWCKGLVDPNWVLKAPLNLCVKKGAGGQILSSVPTKDENGLSIIAVSRDSEYCADEQTCINEKADGSCETYGYCNEEKRTWSFNSDSCAPVYNTCQTFSSASKQSVSYLQNTLDFSTCSASNSGCKQYVYGGVYSADTNKISWDKRYSIFLNNQATNCNATSEGCTQLLRGKPGWNDANFIMNSDFSLNNIGDNQTSANWHWPIKVGSGEIISGKALNILGANGSALYSDNTSSLLPKNLSVIPGWSYTLSAEVKITLGDKVTVTLGGLSSDVITKDTWQTVSVVVTADKGMNSLNFAITGTGAQVNFALRNLKLTPNDFASSYKNYGAFPTYEKLLPAYLESVCYNSVSGTGDYTLKADAPAVCSNFARKCNRTEVGCELYTSVKDNFAVAAKANSADYCDAKCIGYDTYLAKASYFYGNSADNIIPTTAKTCSAESAGCASFTNLDAAAAGGETLEYYAKVRQCIKPDTTSCGDFYSWDNSQLKVMSLKKDTGGDPFVVDTLADTLCTKDIYNLAPTDPKYNPDCREFYNKSGQITYHIYSNTVSCSDNCHTYRLNEKNIDANLVASTCTGNDKNWDTGASACYVCKNGGTWNSQQNSCLYQAVPDEGTTCSAAEVGCREYNGNNGNNLRLVASYDFEAGVDNFSGVSGASVSQSTESTAKNGHSLSFAGNGTTEVDVSNFAKKDSSYVIKFMAKAAANVNTKFSLENSDGAISNFGATESDPQGNLVVKGDNQWNLYEINLRSLDHETKAEKLKIKADGNFFIDHVVVTEISDRYYLIKGSSVIPDVCYYDMTYNKASGALGTYQGPNYNLGCAEYKDRSGIINNLHQFSELCQDSAIGCEQMIQTNNSSDYYGYTLNLNATDRNTACTPGTPGCVEVKGHQAIYAVYDPSKLCNSADLGCTRFGYSQTTGNTTNWADAYKKNLPDTYKSDTASPLCQANEVGCDTWANETGSNSYFKDPGSNTCVYKNSKWIKSTVKRCDVSGDGKIIGTEKDGAICLTDADCSGKKCIIDTNEYACTITELKTFGFGGLGNTIKTPDSSVGICTAESATCSEYIDPVSSAVSNLVNNPAAENIDKDGKPDGWLGSGSYTQKVNVKQNKLYVFQVDGPATSATTITGLNTLRTLGATSANELSGPVGVVSISASGSIVFYSGTNTYLTITRYGATTNTTVDKVTVSLRESIVNYQLSSNIDASTCNGVVNTDGGCVLFNARTQVGASGLQKLTFAATAEGQAPAACNGANCVANSVIKVAPDRVCSRWLSCRTYVEDPLTHERTCYAMGECDQLNDKNECGNFVNVDGVTRDISNSQNKNATGYSLLGNYYLGGMKEVGQNTDAHFDFESNSINLSCRRNVGVTGVANTPCIWDKNINDSLILEPTGSPTDYPAHGKGYLKVLNYYQISPQAENASTQIYTNQDYYINYLVNTKGSSAKAKVMITDETGSTVHKTFSGEESNGWSREVHQFKITSSKNEQIKIKIYLSSDTTDTNTGYVYFDDINIEPVLQTGSNNYVSKDCRLYPSDDSLSCLSANNNVIKDGLYGYCLQYDPNNLGVCLMWYPIDTIAPVTRSSQSTLGYSGKFPLYYCSEANGNFQVVEKIKVFEVAHDFGDNWNEMHQSDSNIQNICIDLLGHRCDNSDTCYVSTKPQANSGVITKGLAKNVYPTCGSDNYKLMLNIHASKDSYQLRIFCVPDPVKVKGTTGEDTSVNKFIYDGQPGCDKFSDSWVPYDGLAKGTVYSSEPSGDKDRSYSESINDVAFSEDSGNFSINKLKPIVTTDTTDYYHFTCNRFTQVVDNEGNNQAWAGRVGRGSLFSTTTPDFFYNTVATPNYSYAPGSTVVTAPTGVCSGSSPFCDVIPAETPCMSAPGCSWTVTSNNQSTGNPHEIKLYGRNREDVPFGAAVFPSNFDLVNSERINLRNQYSKKNSETVFAGRPYGCTGASCKYIGQCSLDPNVFCIYTGSGSENSDANKVGCSGGGNGTCIPLWESIIPEYVKDSPYILNKLFVKNYADYNFTSGYTTASGTPFLAPDCSPVGVRPSSPDKSFCKVSAVVTNLKMTYGGVDAKLDISGNLSVDSGNLYQLEFNSKVDVEQQPLKQIIIKWGNNDIQIVTNLDNKPQIGTPHKFYHYYSKGTYPVGVKIIDNWGGYGCMSVNGLTGDTGCLGL